MFAFGYKAPALSPFDPAQGRLPSRLVRFNDASDPSCDRSHSAVLLVGHGPHFDLAPGEGKPPGVNFSVALAENADGRSESIAGLLVSRSTGQQRCPRGSEQQKHKQGVPIHAA